MVFLNKLPLHFAFEIYVLIYFVLFFWEVQLFNLVIKKRIIIKKIH